MADKKKEVKKVDESKKAKPSDLGNGMAKETAVKIINRHKILNSI